MKMTVWDFPLSSPSSKLYLVTGDGVRSLSNAHRASEAQSCTDEKGRQRGLCLCLGRHLGTAGSSVGSQCCSGSSALGVFISLNYLLWLLELHPRKIHQNHLKTYTTQDDRCVVIDKVTVIGEWLVIGAYKLPAGWHIFKGWESHRRIVHT